MVGFVRLLREDEKLEKVPSVRATIGLYERSQSEAYLTGKAEVSFKDVQNAVISVLTHRIRLKPSVRYLERPEKYLKNIFDKYVLDKYSEFYTKSIGGDG
jgi:hypothetical protein